MKEKVLKTLEELGFSPELAQGNDGYYIFQYEGLNYLWMVNDDDPQFLSFSLPGILDVDDDNRELVRDLIERINSSIKYIKVYLMSPDSVWMFYERKLMDEEDYEKVISHMIFQLERSNMYALNTYRKMQEEANEE